MAVIHLKHRVGQPQRYSCLTTDTFPTEGTENELEPGALLYVINVTTQECDHYEWTSLKWQRTHYRGSANIHDADVHNSPVNEYFHEHTGIISTLSVATVGNEHQITVANGSLYSAGDGVQIGNGIRELTHPIITNIATNVLTLDRQIDFVHAVGVEVEIVEKDMNVLGTMASPRKFKLIPEPGSVFHITRILITITHTTASDLGLFGNLSRLANGVVLRVYVGGQYYTFTNWKAASEIKDDMFDVEFDTRSSGGGTYGTSCRGSFDRIKVAVRLDGSDSDYMEVYVQDDLSTLLSFNIKGQGHFE